MAVSAYDILRSPYRVRLPRSATFPPSGHYQDILAPSSQKSPGRSTRLSFKYLFDLIEFANRTKRKWLLSTSQALVRKLRRILATTSEFQPGSIISPSHIFRAHSSPVHWAASLGNNQYRTDKDAFQIGLDKHNRYQDKAVLTVQPIYCLLSSNCSFSYGQCA